MSLWRQITRGLSVLCNRKTADQDVADEVLHYVDEATADFIAKGLSPDDARRAARAELGNETVVREQVREYGWENVIDTFFADLRYAVRRLLKKPGFAVASLLTLALGIGATTAILSVINGVLLKPLPYPHSERIVALMHTAPGVNIKQLNMSPALYFTYSEESRAFQDVGMWTPGTLSISGIGEPEEVPALMVTNRFLSTLGVQLALGRGFTADDDDPRSERKVILSNGYWKSRFGGDRSVIGRRVMMDGNAREVVGVLPPSFQFMDRKISMLIPLRFNRSEVRLIQYCCQGIAMLKPGVTLTQANADVARMLPMAAARFPMNPGLSSNMFVEARVAPTLAWLKDVLIGDIGHTLWVLMGTVGIVLLIACANVANLLLVRAEGRQQELAIRAALGAGRGRILRELLMESMLLSLLGGALGLALAYTALRILAASELPHLPRVHDISIDVTVLASNIGISLAAGLLFGLAPAFKYARPHLSNALRSGGRSMSQGKEQHRARGLLVIVQVALALVLLVGSGLMVRTFQALRHIDPGFSGAHEIDTFHISIPPAQVNSEVRVMRMEEEILRKIETVNGISSVAMTNTLPLDGGSNSSVYTEGREAIEGATPPNRRWKGISPGYLSAMGSRLIAGREMTWTETYNQTPVALVSENMARELWQNPQAALGKRIRITLKDEWREVIGVVGDLRDDGVDQRPPTIVYWPMLQKHFGDGEPNAERSVAFIIRTPRAGSAGFRQELQRAVASVNPNLPVADLKTLESVYDASLARTTFTVVLLAIAGSMALLLGVIGIYGVISYSVSQRTREIGIRLALGSPFQDLTRMFVRDGLLLSAIGTACGLTVALALTRLMKSVLYEVSPADPLTYFAVSAGLILAAAVASYLPTRRAARVDPAQILRAE